MALRVDSCVLTVVNTKSKAGLAPGCLFQERCRCEGVLGEIVS